MGPVGKVFLGLRASREVSGGGFLDHRIQSASVSRAYLGDPKTLLERVRTCYILGLGLQVGSGIRLNGGDCVWFGFRVAPALHGAL